LTTEEIDNQELFWIKRAQNQRMSDVKFCEGKAQLHLEPNSEDVLVCKGRTQGEYPTYLSDSTSYAAKVVEHTHESTLRGGISFTMAKVREKFWIPRLQKLAKRALITVSLRNPPAGLLPKDRTEGDTPFNVIGVDLLNILRAVRTKGKLMLCYILAV
jgi:hypothetical protein